MDEDAFHKAIEHWLVAALCDYLPTSVLCLVPAPLLPDSSRLDLPTPYLGRPDPASRKAIARFGTITAIFRERGASLFRQIHESYNDSQPVVVLMRQDGDGTSSTETKLAHLCVLNVQSVNGDEPHPGDKLADRFVATEGCLRVPPDLFTPCPEAFKTERLNQTTKGSEKIQEILLQHVKDHPFYTPTLAPILPHAQIVMVLARSIHSNSWNLRRRFGAGGVTFLLKPDNELTDDLITRLCAVAQRVDGLLGSLHFATEDVDRSQAAADALSILKHSVGDNLRDIATLAPEIGPRLTVVQRVLEGSVAFARQRGIAVDDGRGPVPWNKLGFKGQSFDQTLKTTFWGLHSKLEFSGVGFENGRLDSRVLVLMEELFRNLAKGPKGKPGKIVVTCNPQSGVGGIQVSGWENTVGLQRLGVFAELSG